MRSFSALAAGIPEKPFGELTQACILGLREGGVTLEKLVRRCRSLIEKLGVGGKVGDTQFWQAVLSAAEKFAGASHFKVLLGYLEAVGGGGKDPQPFPALVGDVVGY